MELSRIVTKALIRYHGICIDITNCLGQLHLISDEEWEERNKRHCMAVFNNPQFQAYFVNRHTDKMNKED